MSTAASAIQGAPAVRTRRTGGTQPRVLILPASYLARDRTVGGGERYAFEYARALAELTPTTLALFDAVPAVETHGRLEVRTFPLGPLGTRWGFPLTRELWRALAGHDVVHSMVFPTPATDLLTVAALARGRKVVLTDVGGGGPSPSTYLQKLHPRASLNRRAHGLALLSRHAAGFFAGWTQPSTILYGGADLQAFGGAETEPRGYALFVGRLLPHKGVLQLIEALGPETPLHVVGRPYDAEYLERLRSAARGKRVRFFLDADDRELARQYAGANVVLQPSLPVAPGQADTSELLGLVTLEAMGSGKPVIVTRAGSLPELVADGESGFVVPPHDPAALRARTEELVASAALSRAMGEAARERVRALFTWEQVAERGLTLYRELVGAPRGR
ncbi:MAG TPA: glycosyltransferase family 4 protein [Longimicrobiaceae bacterium]|nr:glycosyltransferase family 4 protein [Longimicrobiaceae bacterium]